MKKQIISVVAFMAICLFYVTSSHATCWVTDDADSKSAGHNFSLRYEVEEVNYGNALGGCAAVSSIDGTTPLQDGHVTDDWIIFQTSKTNPTDGNAIDYIKLSVVYGPIRFLPKRILLVGNYSHEAVTNAYGDVDPSVEYVVNEEGEGGYAYRDGKIIDNGRIIIDATDLPTLAGDKSNIALVTPYLCHDENARVIVRNHVFFTNGMDLDDFFGGNHPETSCLVNGGSNFVCDGTPILDHGSYVDPVNDDGTLKNEADWCNRNCVPEKFFKDQDGDGHGDPTDMLEVCEEDLPTDFTYVPEELADDCDDLDPNNYPGNDEVCDDKDNNCNGIVDDNPIDGQTYYADADGDLFGDVTNPKDFCPGDEGTYVTDNNDCNDADPAINPDAQEICDPYDTDEDCDGLVDEADPSVDLSTCGSGTNDDDGDGYIDVTDGGDDCDDTNADVHPGAPEVCNGIDDDCDGLVDIDDPDLTDAVTYYEDADGDTFGNPAVSQDFCPGDEGTYVTDDTDCDDTDPTINPDGTEICDDGIDQDCSGADQACNDMDGDGYIDVADGGDDCDDTDPNVHPGATEICGDGIDQDCDGSDEVCIDDDGDGYDETTDCDDTDPNIYPGAPEICGDGIDQDCDGSDLACNDLDGDGYIDVADGGDDCDDTDPNIHPGATEICGDGIDQDCDGSDLACTGTDDDGDGYIDINDGGDDCDDTDPNINPGAPEICEDGIDQNCDGADDACDIEVCDDTIDNDGDGLVDCDDPDCASFSDCNGGSGTEVCNDTEDNDGDGFVDCEDADCAFDESCIKGGIELDCSDGLDNDKDGLPDCLDSDCADFIPNPTIGDTCAEINLNESPNASFIQGGACNFSLYRPDRVARPSDFAPFVMGFLALFMLGIVRKKKA